METQKNQLSDFQSGSTVIYGIHGKCAITGIETRSIGGESVVFYKLEVQKSSLSRSARPEPAIWVPVETARNRGMRAPISKEDCESVFAIFASREYYFAADESWSSIQHKLEACIRNEGAIGLAKVASYLYVLARKQVVPAPEVNKMQETVNKLLMRELSEATCEQSRTLEEKIGKLLRHKLILDN